MINATPNPTATSPIVSSPFFPTPRPNPFFRPKKTTLINPGVRPTPPGLKEWTVPPTVLSDPAHRVPVHPKGDGRARGNGQGIPFGKGRSLHLGVISEDHQNPQGD